MNWNTLTARISRMGRGGTASFVLPTLVMEVEPGFVLAAQVDRSAGRVRRIGARELQAHALEPLTSQPNVANPAELQRAAREVTEAVGGAAGQTGLLVPDPVVRVAILSFETLPHNRQEADALVGWRMKEFFPFPLEEARVSYQVLRASSSGVELFAMAAKNSVLAEYEMAVSPTNGGPALTLPATAALLPLLAEGDDVGQLLIHVCSGWVTAVVVEGDRPRVWRTRNLGQLTAEQLAQEVASEAARVEASARDHLKLRIERLYLCARPAASQELISSLAAAVSSTVDLLAPAPHLSAALPDAEGAVFQRFGATVAGVVLNSGNKS